VGNEMRILNADILDYALYDESPAHTPAWQLLERSVTKEIDLYVTPITIQETYNTLYDFYRVRPLKSLLEKLTLTIEGLKVLETSINGLKISATDNIPLSDGFLIATALHHNKPIIVTNDQHIINKAPKYGLITENPITEEIRKKLARWKIDP
jgi:predicted nucleic acid-binding protein